MAYSSSCFTTNGVVGGKYSVQLIYLYFQLNIRCAASKA